MRKKKPGFYFTLGFWPRLTKETRFLAFKALLQKKGIPTPTFGKKGHNLHELWQASGLHFSDLRDPEGKQTFFLQDWDTSLRYERNLPKSLGLEIPDLLAGAKQLNQWIQTQVRRSKPRK